jgi:tight adherence protein C
VTGALAGFLLSTGLLLVASGWARTRRPSLDQRLTPYLRDVHPYVAAPGRSIGVLDAVFGPSIRRTGQVVGDLLGGSASVSRRLVRLGSTSTLEDFRIVQVLWGAAGLAAATGLSALLWSERGTGVPILLIICAIGFLSGILLCDNNLSSRVAAHEQELQAEFPVVADLLALAVAAGESPVAGLERIMKVCHGALSDELERVVADIRTGAPMASAFDGLAARTGVTSIARFAEGLAIAVERGTPLVDVLHAQAADVREAGRRELMEAGGRKEVAMMVPVVFLILPITIVFAFCVF